MQMFGDLHCFHPNDIQVLLEATTKHSLGNTTIPFESKDLELTTVLMERLNPPKIPQLTEAHWVLKEWDDIMAFMLSGQDLLLPIVPGQFEDPPIIGKNLVCVVCTASRQHQFVKLRVTTRSHSYNSLCPHPDFPCHIFPKLFVMQSDQWVSFSKAFLPCSYP